MDQISNKVGTLAIVVPCYNESKCHQANGANSWEGQLEGAYVEEGAREILIVTSFSPRIIDSRTCPAVLAVKGSASYAN